MTFSFTTKTPSTTSSDGTATGRQQSSSCTDIITATASAASQIEDQDWEQPYWLPNGQRALIVRQLEPTDESGSRSKSVDAYTREAAFRGLGLVWGRNIPPHSRVPISYPITEITIITPNRKSNGGEGDGDGGDDDDDGGKTEVTRIYRWDGSEMWHDPLCGSSTCIGASGVEQSMLPSFKAGTRPSLADIPCNSQLASVTTMFDMFENFAYLDPFSEVETGIPKDVPLTAVPMTLTTLSGRNDFKHGIGLLGEETFLTRFHHPECHSRFCAGSGTEEQARIELLDPSSFKNDQKEEGRCRPDVYLGFDPEGHKIHQKRFSSRNSEIDSIYDAVRAMAERLQNDYSRHGDDYGGCIALDRR